MSAVEELVLLNGTSTGIWRPIQVAEAYEATGGVGNSYVSMWASR